MMNRKYEALRRIQRKERGGAQCSEELFDSFPSLSNNWNGRSGDRATPCFNTGIDTSRQHSNRSFPTFFVLFSGCRRRGRLDSTANLPSDCRPAPPPKIKVYHLVRIYFVPVPIPARDSLVPEAAISAGMGGSKDYRTRPPGISGLGWTILLFLVPICPASGFVHSQTPGARRPTTGTASSLILLRTAAAADDDVAHQQPSQLHIQVTDSFISKVSESVVDSTFVSFTLRGPKAPRKRKQKKSSAATMTDYDALAAEKERLRGCVKTVHGRLIALQDKKKKKKNEERIYMQATTKYHGATDLAENWLVSSSSTSSSDSYNGAKVEEGLRRILYPDMIAKGSEWGASPLSNPDLGIRTAELATTLGTCELNLSVKKPKLKFIKQKSNHENESGINEQKKGANHQIASHDRAKNVPLLPSEPFFQRLGVSDKDGKPKKNMKSKLRQCLRFCEIVGHLVDTSITSQSSSDQITTISSADMGCGRGYLTFSLHSFLSKKYSEQYNVQSRGIEVRPKLVSETNQIAKELGHEFVGLRFAEGTIENVVLGKKDGMIHGEGGAKSLNILIALHACDTATDDALWSGIREGADVIVTAPCCHKEVRRQLDPYLATAKDHPLADVLRHNIYRERMAETVTDSMRALLLEIANYSVQVFEFIGGEHSAKNVMITATKCQKQRSASELKQLRKRFRELSALHGVERQRLAEWMGESLSEHKPSQLSSKKMPPLPIDPFK